MGDLSRPINEGKKKKRKHRKEKQNPDPQRKRARIHAADGERFCPEPVCRAVRIAACRDTR